MPSLDRCKVRLFAEAEVPIVCVPSNEEYYFSAAVVLSINDIDTFFSDLYLYAVQETSDTTIVLGSRAAKHKKNWISRPPMDPFLVSAVGSTTTPFDRLDLYHVGRVEIDNL